jgi:Ca2+-binding RTX toxin-like protein
MNRKGDPTMATLNLTPNNDKKPGTGAADSINGLAGNDTLTGLAGNDTLNGGVGSDSLDGGTDNDTLIGDTGMDTLLGGAGNDSLDGGADNDKLDGGAGADTLNGGTGADNMSGGDGNDLYLVDNIGDKVAEVAKATSGTDTVRSSVDYTLPLNIENLELSGLANLNGTGNTQANKITGNEGDNWLDGGNGFDTLMGGAGDDTLIGGGGIDQLIGGDGSDTYQISSTEDTIIETAKGGDQDVVESSVSYVLGDNLEVLILTGTGSIDGTGNTLDNTLEGNDAGDQLRGENGNDSLHGNGGDDTLDGGAGNDEIDGGDGDDQVVYTRNRDDYRIVLDESNDTPTWVVEDTTGEEGADRLINIETLRFADGTYVPGLPVLSVADISLNEGQKGTRKATFIFTLSEPAQGPVTVDYATVDDTAQADSDYMALKGTLTIPKGETRQSLSVTFLGDLQVEPDEAFHLQLTNVVGAQLDTTEATATLVNDDLPSLSIKSLSVPEGNNGVSKAVLTVSLAQAVSQPVIVQYATAPGGTAIAGDDYTPATGSLSFKPGETSKTFTVDIKGDTRIEANETFRVQLTNPQNAQLDTTAAAATVTITNDDQPTLAITASQSTLKSGDTAALTFAFSDVPQGFDLTDVKVRGGQLDQLKADASGKTWTARFTPDAGQNTLAGSVSVPAGSYRSGKQLGAASNTLTLTGDTQAPTLTGSTPANNASGVLVDSNLTLTFNEPVQAGSGNIMISNGNDTRMISTTDRSQVSYSDNTVIINPIDNLLGNNTHYWVTIDQGAFRDVAQNPYPGILSADTLGFTTSSRKYGTSGDDPMNGTPGDDWLEGGNGRDNINGFMGADTLIGGNVDGVDNQSNFINGGEGNDSLIGGSKEDYLYGDSGNDTLNGMDGNDSLLDYLGGNDVLDGGNGNDTLKAGSGDDVLMGGDGNDILIGGDGNDTYTGGTGQDFFQCFNPDVPPEFYSGQKNSILVTDFKAGSSGDILDLNTVLSLSIGYTDENPFGAAGYLRLQSIDNNTVLQWDRDGAAGKNYNWQDSILLQNVEAKTLVATNFSPVASPNGNMGTGFRIVGTESNDVIHGGLSADTLLGADGRDTLYGGPGNDWLEGGPATGEEGLGINELHGGLGADTLIGITLNDHIYDGIRFPPSVDYYGDMGNDSLIGSSAVDIMEGGSGNDTLAGQSGNDLLIGDNGNDLLQGGEGADTLDGGNGNDTCTGGAGRDVYLLNASYSSEVNLVTVTDFEAGINGDVLDMTRLFQGFQVFGPGGGAQDPLQSIKDRLQLIQSGNDTLVQFSPPGSTGSPFGTVSTWQTLVRLQNVPAALLLGDNFLPQVTPNRQLTLSIKGTALKEGSSGNDTNASLEISLSTVSSQPVSVSYTTVDGTATHEEMIQFKRDMVDYIPSNGIVYFAPGETSKKIDIPVMSDDFFEPDETFQVILSNAMNAALDATSSTAAVTLVNDDLPANTLTAFSHEEMAIPYIAHHSSQPVTVVGSIDSDVDMGGIR